jgi:hypothetical protein
MNNQLRFPSALGRMLFSMMVGVDFQYAVVHKPVQGFPPFQSIINGLTEQSLR